MMEPKTAANTNLPPAYSNPIYGELQNDEQSSSNKPSYRPIPKPRLSITKKKLQQQQQNESSMEASPSPQPPPPTPQNTPNKRSSSLCLGDIRMTQLLEEIYSLTDSLQKNFSSAPDVEEHALDHNIEQISHTSTVPSFQDSNGVYRRTISRRKRIPVRSDLLKMSFSNEDSPPSPTVKPARASAAVQTDEPTVESSADSGVFGLMNKDETSTCDANSGEDKVEDDSPPKLPPRRPLRLDIVPARMDPIKNFDEQLPMEHLHKDTLSLQRSGYLWKTGHNYKSFKNRWCVLYRHSQNYYDANLSYYFNRSSMAASLSGKILLAEIEFISVSDVIPAKTRLPKIENSTSTCSSNKTFSFHSSSSNDHVHDSNHNNDQQNQSLCFFEIGVKSRQGRIYLFAARSDSDRQLWIHAFVQAITLHAFKNKEICHCGFIRARFTITANWQTCFAILTSDRFFYVFEMEADNPIPTLDCKQYHVFNLRKTVRLCRLDEQSTCQPTQSNQQTPDGVGWNPARSTTGNDAGPFIIHHQSPGIESCCKHGFSLTQNGGHVIYLISLYESHINHWYRSIWRLWMTPRQPVEKLILCEQYLTSENVPVAFDKCLKFLDTFNHTCLNLFGPMQDSIHETSSICLDDHHHRSRHISQPQSPPLTPMSSDMDLRTQQQLLQQLRFDSWNVHLLPQKYNACQISQLLLLYLRSMNECLFTEQLLPYWIKLASVTDAATPTNPSTPTNSSNNNEWITLKNEQMKRLLRLMPPVNYATLRRFIIYLSNATHKNEEYQLSTSLCKTMFFSKPASTHNRTQHPVPISIARSLLTSLIENNVWLFDVTKEELEKELHIKRVVNLIINQNRKENAKKQQSGNSGLNLIRSHTNDHLSSSLVNSKHGAQRINSLIIGIKVWAFGLDNQPTTVNVHINRSTTARDIFEMILEKVKLKESTSSNYSVFEVICNGRLERIIMGKERVLPLVLCWTNWPSHWSLEACIEIKPTEQLLRPQPPLPLLEHATKPSKQPISTGIKLPNVNAIRFEPNAESLNYQPTMLMSVIRYGGQSDTRLVKHILAEFSSSQLFLYCKETHHLLGQYALHDIYWYVGLESASMFQYQPPVRCSTIVNDDGDDEASSTSSSSSSNAAIGSSNNRRMKPQPNQSGKSPSAPTNTKTITQSDYGGIPALTIIERQHIKSRQSCHERRNFGQTLLFNSWTELNQWIKGLLEASIHKEMFDI